MIPVIIVDDEPPSQAELSHIINRHPNFTVAGIAGSGREALNLVAKLKPQVAFLDIQLYDLNGLELAEKISAIKEDIYIIFATAHDDYALKAYELNAVDYVVKPFDELRVYKTLNRIFIRITQQTPLIRETDNNQKEPLDRICAGNNDRLSVVDCKDIYYIAAHERKTIIKLYNDLLPSFYTLKEIYQRLNKRNFIQIHRSYVVNMQYVKEIMPWFHGNYKLIVNDLQKTELPISRNFISNLKQKLGIKPEE